MQIHSGDKPYMCNQCEKTFSMKRGLEKHMQVHTGDKPLKCNQLEKTFSMKQHLDRHMQIYTEDKHLIKKTVLNLFLVFPQYAF